jgi:hypothetical protein
MNYSAAHTKVDRQVIRALKTPVTKMTERDWDDIQKKGSKIARDRKKAAQLKPR